MKPPNVTSVLLVGRQDSHKSSFLLQGAVHYAEQGHTIIYITATEFDSLPLPIHGMTRLTPDVFSLIKFLYLPCWQDLLQHLYSLHLHALVPTVIIVESLDHFCAEPDPGDLCNSSTRSTEASHAALVCAALLDGTAVCAKRSKSQAHLIVSLNQNPSDLKMAPLIDIFFTDVVWMFEKVREDNNSTDETCHYSMVNLETKGSLVKQYKILFSPEPSVGAVVVDKVSLWEKIQRAPL